MVRARWRTCFGPPSIVLGLALLTAAITTSAVIAANSPPVAGSAGQCPTSPAKAARAATTINAGARSEARIEQRLNPKGMLTGRALRVSPAGMPMLEIALPVESFVAPRTGNAVVYTRSGGGRGSEVHLVNLATGCDTVVAEPSGIVRSATLAPDASAVYVHSVARGSRSDAGVMRHDLTTGATELVVPVLSSVPRLGRIFATQLSWSLGGEFLTVQSCGFSECLSRVLDLASGGLARVDAPGQGALIGTTDSKLITYASCPGIPCAVIAFDLASGDAGVLSAEAFGATLRTRLDGRAVIEISTADGVTEVSL